MNLLQMLNQVLSQSAHIKKNAFATSNDVDDIQMMSIANRVQQEICNIYDWPELRREATITIIGGQRRYQLPDDYRSLVPDSMYKRGSNRRIEIHTPDRRWYEYKYRSGSSGPGSHARFYGNDIEFEGIEDSDVVNFEYVSKWAVIDDTGAVKELFTNDSDTWSMEDQLLILGIQAHWAQTKVLPQEGQWMNNYQRKLNEAIGRRTGGRTIGGRQIRGRDRSPYTPLYK